MALINFSLRHPDDIIPWGDAPDLTIHWFGLTEGEYWLDVSKASLYEYTSEVLTGGGNDARFVEFQIARLIEDWTSLFDAIVEPLPDDFYSIVRTSNYLYRFYAAAQSWLEELAQDPLIDEEVYYNRYDKVIEWIYSRTLTAMHLTAGPGVSFFRSRDKMAIVWKADHVTENNIPVWTAQNGEIEMAYEGFIREIADFGNRFFDAMDNQVRIALDKDWGSTVINKERLKQEQQERKDAFQKNLAVLKGEPVKHTDWELINALLTQMFSHR